MVSFMKKRKKVTQERQAYLDFIEEQLESDGISLEEAGFLRGVM